MLTPLNVVAAAGGTQFFVTAGDGGSGLLGFRSGSPLAFGSISGSLSHNGATISDYINQGSTSERFVLSFDADLANDDSAWIDSECSGVYVSGQQSVLFTRAGSTFIAFDGTKTQWLQPIGSQTDNFIVSNVYSCKMT